MFAKSTVVSLALIAAAAPSFSAPLPETRSTEVLDARALPAGLVGLLKSLGSGVLSGGAISGLLALLGGGDDAAAARRAFEDSIAERAVPAAAVSSGVGAAAKAAAKALGTAFAGGVGSTLGSLSITAIFDKLFGDDAAAAKRELSDLTDEELNTLLEWVNDNKGSLSARGFNETLTAILEKLFGNAVQRRGVEDSLSPRGFNEILTAVLEKLFGNAVQRRELSDLTDEELNTLLEWVNANEGSLSARGFNEILTAVLEKLFGNAVQRREIPSLNELD